MLLDSETAKSNLPLLRIRRLPSPRCPNRSLDLFSFPLTDLPCARQIRKLPLPVLHHHKSPQKNSKLSIKRKSAPANRAYPSILSAEFIICPKQTPKTLNPVGLNFLNRPKMGVIRNTRRLQRKRRRSNYAVSHRHIIL
jgi:hypothetical protein